MSLQQNHSEFSAFSAVVLVSYTNQSLLNASKNKSSESWQDMNVYNFVNILHNIETVFKTHSGIVRREIHGKCEL